jgi:hypothetical protein
MTLPTVELRETADRLVFSRLVWFSASGSGPAIKPVTAAFLSYEEAAAWAARHPGQTVHFPGGGQLQARYALADGLEAFTRRCTEGLAAKEPAAA